MKERKEPFLSRRRLGEKIREFRDEKDISQMKLAVRIDSTQASISRMEAGERSFKVDALIHIGTELGFTVELLKKEP